MIKKISTSEPKIKAGIKTKDKLITELPKTRGWISKLEKTEIGFEGRKKMGHGKMDILFTTLGVIREGIITIDKNGIITLINPAVEKMFGYKKTEIVGRPFETIIPERYQTFYKNNIDDYFKTGKPNNAVGRSFERLGLHKNGGEIPIDISIYEADYNDKQLLLVVLLDLSERKQLEKTIQEKEENFRNVTSSANDAIIMADEKGNISFWNSAAEKIFGYDKTEVIGKDMATHIFPENVAQEMKNRLESFGIIGKDLFIGKTNEIIAKRKNGEQFLMELSLSALKIKDKIQSLGIIRDITERKQLEEEIQKASKLESVGILAGGIAHDFNNLLTSIVGNTSLAIEITNSEDEVYDMLIDAEKAAQRAQDLTQQLLTFSKGGAPIKKLTSIVTLVKDSIRFALTGSKVKCDIFIPDNLWTVEIDEGQINQVINNLIINANQAMPEGGMIELHTENINVGYESFLPLKEGKYVKISIKDQGIGIEEEHLKKIFDPYFTTKENGCGFGLATSYSIIKKHDGYITVESMPNKGTTFYIYIPASPQNIQIQTAKIEKINTGKGKVLVLDDEEDVRKIAGKMLNRFGCKVEFAKDGVEAIETYKSAIESQDPFDFIIMDLTIPGGMGGEEAIKKILEIDPGVTAIVSSGYSNDPIVANFSEYGFSDFLAKPYKMAELNRVVQSLTDNDN